MAFLSPGRVLPGTRQKNSHDDTNLPGGARLDGGLQPHGVWRFMS